jgi:hypothetical protein
MARVELSEKRCAPGLKKDVGDLKSLPDGKEWIKLSPGTDCWCYGEADFWGDPIHFHNGRDLDMIESIEEMSVRSIRVRTGRLDGKIARDGKAEFPTLRELRDDERAKIKSRSKEFFEQRNADGHFQAAYVNQMGAAIKKSPQLPWPMDRLQHPPVIKEGSAWELAFATTLGFLRKMKMTETLKTIAFECRTKPEDIDGLDAKFEGVIGRAIGAVETEKPAESGGI